LKVAQVLVAERAIVGCDAVAIVRVMTRFHLID
jgi:hypothetical protein